jgi:hypothetical protein
LALGLAIGRQRRRLELSDLALESQQWVLECRDGFFSYALCGRVSKLRTLVLELDRRVRERTSALQREVAERQRLDQEIARVADRERR